MREEELIMTYNAAYLQGITHCIMLTNKELTNLSSSQNEYSSLFPMWYFIFFLLRLKWQKSYNVSSKESPSYTRSPHNIFYIQNMNYNNIPTCILFNQSTKYCSNKQILAIQKWSCTGDKCFSTFFFVVCEPSVLFQMMPFPCTGQFILNSTRNWKVLKRLIFLKIHYYLKRRKTFFQTLYYLNPENKNQKLKIL